MVGEVFLSQDFNSLSEQIHKGVLKSRQLVEETLIAGQQHVGLNALTYLDETIALQEADRIDALALGNEADLPLRGLPIVVKDNIHVAGMPNTAGTPALRNFIPKQDSSAVAALRRAGAIILAKANMHELAFGITSDNWAFGRVGNAYDSSVIAGGSSGGSAVAVAMGMAAAALGTDTGGSVRIPAALNGLCGLRSTIGRYATDGVTPVAHTRDSVGTMARSMADLIRLDGVLSTKASEVSPDISLPGLRLGVPRTYFFESLQSDVASAVESLFIKLQEQGVTLVDVEIENLKQLNEETSFTIALYEVVEDLKSYLLEYEIGIELSDLIEEMATSHTCALLKGQLHNPISREQYENAINHSRPLLQQSYRDCFAENNISALIFPTTPLTAKPLQKQDDTVLFNGESLPSFPTYIRNTDPGSNAGLPGLTLPIGLDVDGLPIGIELDGLPNTDRTLLAIGLEMEKVLTKLPPPAGTNCSLQSSHIIQ